MNHLYRRILTVLAIGVLLTSAIAAQGPRLAPEPVEGEVYYAPFPVNITLDGEFSDWNGVPQAQMGPGVGRPAVNFAAAADADTLYVWGEVIDDNIISGEHGEDYWNEDSLEFYFNGTGNFERTSYTEGIAQLTIPPLNIGAAPDDMVLAGVQYDTLNAEVITVATDRGWAVEVAIPLESDIWSIQPAQDLEMGFQVHLNAASEENRDTKLIWSILDSSDTSYQNPSVFGRLSFYEVASEPSASGEYFFRSEISDNRLIDDFESGIWMNAAGPHYMIGLVPGGSAILSIQQAPQETALALPQQRDVANNLLAITYDEDEASYMHAFTDGLNPTTQDWSGYDGLGMWIYDTEDDSTFDIVLHTAGDHVYQYTLDSASDSWQYVIIPFDLFQPQTDAPQLDAASVQGYGVHVPANDEDGTIYLDNVKLYMMENTEAVLSRDAMPQERFIVDESINWESREWELVWLDEFEAGVGEPISDANWTCETGGEGWGNNELEYYTTSLENVSHTEEGYLAITAMRGQPENNERCWYGQCAFTSARCITRDKVEFTHGRVEARLQIPRGQGIWPAFWMLGADFGEVGWPNSGEIDIMENVGFEPDTVHGTIHGPGYSGASGIGNGYSLPGQAFADDFHVYALEWDPYIMRWYVDGELFSTISINDVGNYEWVYEHDFFMILNVAVGGAWPGNPDETTEMPQQMLVDYVRVYQEASD